MSQSTLNEIVRRRFEADGVVIREWAEDRGFKPEQVYAVLSGRSRGVRGLAHKIAVELGIKSTSNQDNYVPGDGKGASE
jgi:gp16 family phage-associated protein